MYPSPVSPASLLPHRHLAPTDGAAWRGATFSLLFLLPRSQRHSPFFCASVFLPPPVRSYSSPRLCCIYTQQRVTYVHPRTCTQLPPILTLFLFLPLYVLTHVSLLSSSCSFLAVFFLFLRLARFPPSRNLLPSPHRQFTTHTNETRHIPTPSNRRRSTVLLARSLSLSLFLSHRLLH